MVLILVFSEVCVIGKGKDHSYWAKISKDKNQSIQNLLTEHMDLKSEYVNY